MTTTMKKATITIEGTEVTLSNLDKTFWPEAGFTKGDLIKFYTTVFPYLKPHLAGRPLVATRYPGGIHGKSFYQKNAPAGTPAWVSRFPWYSDHSKRIIYFIICDRLATMIWLANQACIELHPWMSRIEHIDFPDYFVLDLDPAEGATYHDVCQVARAAKDVLDRLNLRFYVKTSGLAGLHLYIPVAPLYRYEILRGFAQRAAEAIVDLVPNIATVERRIKNRNARVYVDYLQNIQGKTVCSPYSVRPGPHAPVSTPLDWRELEQAEPWEYNMVSLPGRLAKKGDLFSPVLTDRQKLDKVRI